MVSSKRLSFLANKTTDEPNFENSFAVAAPIPDEAPLI
jgi:hypothetical protein